MSKPLDAAPNRTYTPPQTQHAPEPGAQQMPAANFDYADAGPTDAALDRLQPATVSECKRCGSPVLDAESVCPNCGALNLYVARRLDTPHVLDWHAVIRESLADCSVLLDRAEHDPASMHGVVARLLNAVTTLVDDNKALAERVSALESR
jgi:ribosomal protein L32